MRNVIFGSTIFTILIGLSLLLAFLPAQIDLLNEDQYITDELNLKIQDLEGNINFLSDFLGSKLIIDFFATWCAPCEVQEGILQKIQISHPEVTIISLSVYALDSDEVLIPYKEEHSIPWFLGRDFEFAADELFGTIQLPTVAYIDESGKLLQLEHQLVSEEVIESWINGNVITDKIIVSPIGDLTISSAIGLPLFFLIGLFVALSPCLFPIMPLTLLHVLNKSAEHDANDETDQSSNKHIQRRLAIGWVTALWSGILFSFIIFALIGVVIGAFLIQYYVTLNFLFGLILLGLGIIILYPQLENYTFARIPVPNRAQRLMDKEEFSNVDLFALGSGYSFIALPCAGPVFLVMLPLIIGTANPFFTLAAILLFGIGLYLPYLGLVLVTTEARIRFISIIRERYIIVKNLTALFIVFIGFLLIRPFILELYFGIA